MQLPMDRIDAFLAQLDTAKDDGELRRMFQTFSAEYDTQVPDDPFSDAYREQQFRLYEKLAGKAYSPDNEVSQFEVEEFATRPFPYSNESSELVGNQLLAIGFLIKAMNLPPRSKILEFGPGWGNTTLALAKMGHDVTAVDIEKNFVDLIARRAAMENLNVNVFRGDFSLIESLEQQFDAVLFFECFHHAQDHMRLIQSFDRILAPGGIVCLASEPIVEDFPIPWGLRMDGESIWAIRKNGWLELGFRKSYFDAALGRHGFVGVDHVGVDGPWSKAIVVRRKSEMRVRYGFGGSELIHGVGELGPDGLRISEQDRGFAAYGPYKPLRRGRWRATIEMAPGHECAGVLTIDVADQAGTVAVVEPMKVHLSSGTSAYPIEFFSERDLQNFEIRIMTKRKARATIAAITMEYL